MATCCRKESFMESLIKQFIPVHNKVYEARLNLIDFFNHYKLFPILSHIKISKTSSRIDIFFEVALKKALWESGKLSMNHRKPIPTIVNYRLYLTINSFNRYVQ